MILTVDANEHAVKVKLARQLKTLGIVESFYTKFNPKGGPVSYFRGRHQIDEVWCTRNVMPTEVSICPYHFCT